MCLIWARHVSHLFQLGETCVSPFSIPGSNTALQSTGVEDSTFLCLVQDNFLTQHVLEPTRAARVLDIVLSSQKEFVDNVVIQEPLGSSDHNQLHFNIKIKSDKTKVKQCRRDFRKGNYRCIRKLGNV